MYATSFYYHINNSSEQTYLPNNIFLATNKLLGYSLTFMPFANGTKCVANMVIKMGYVG